MKNNVEYQILDGKKKKSNWKTRSAKAGVGILAFAAGLAGAFFLVPTRVNTINVGRPEQGSTDEDTYFSKFASKITPLIASPTEEIEEAFGLEASLDGLKISWPKNEISLKGELKASIKSLRNIALSLDVDVDYNSKAIDLGVAYLDETFYLCTKDLNLKQCFTTAEDASDEFSAFVGHLKDLFFDPENKDGMQIELQLDQLVGSLIGGIDLSSLTSGSGLEVEETEDDYYAYTDLKIAIDEETSIKIGLTIEKETVSLVAVDLGTMQFGDVKIQGCLNCRSSSDVKVLGFDDPNYTYKKRDKFTSIINYKSWVDDIFTLLNTRTVGLDISASLRDENYSYGFVNAGIDLDASRFEPINFIGKVIGPELLNKEENSEVVPAEAAKEESIVDVLNNFDFNVGLELGNYKVIDGVTKLVDYSNLGLAYFKDSDEKHSGYLTLNEDAENAVMRAKIDVDTINYLISEITNLVSGADKKATKEAKQEDGEGLFDFVVKSDLVTAIQDGRYDGIIEMIENIESTEKTIQISVNLSSLGFGSNSKLVLKLDAEKKADTPTKVISIEAKNVQLKNFVLDAEISTRKYDKYHFEHIDSIRDKFDELNFVPGTFEQVTKIVDEKQLGLKITGDAYDEEKVGFEFDGWAQMDLNENAGFGHIEFDEYKIPGQMQTPHTVDISIDNKDGDHSKNNMLFEYRESLKGRFTLKTFDDLIDIVMKLIKTPDKRFTKFLGPILEKIMGSVIVTSIQEKDYLALSQSSLITSIKQVNDGNSIDIVLSKELLMELLPSDLTLRINFKKDAKNQKCIDSLEVVELDALGKKINAKIQLTEFVTEIENPVDLSANFLDFSDIAVLLAFGIDTVQLDYYHVTLKAKITLGETDSWLKVPLDTLTLDCHLMLVDDKLKVYCSLPQSANPLIDMSAEFVFEPNEIEDDLLGGRFYILRKDRPTGLQLLAYSRQDVLFVAEDEFFADNLISYLLQGLLALGRSTADSLVNTINNSSSSSNVNDPKYENIFTDTGFNYVANDSKNTYTWTTGISIEALTGKNTIGPVEATIVGEKKGDKSFLKSAHATLNIASIIGITADITLSDLNPDTKSWPQEIEEKYQAVIHYYSGDINNIINNLDGYKVKK